MRTKAAASRPRARRRDNPKRRSRRLAHSILANERGNVKFNFLVPGDPYHAYYQHKVRAARQAAAAQRRLR